LGIAEPPFDSIQRERRLKVAPIKPELSIRAQTNRFGESQMFGMPPN